ncbi:DNA polymerase III subunit beta [Candidatus Saccharibacteria bacterium]|nr:DNA polymerase III subunit beta [Candidatus Saccharibacteria bacterium]
MEIEVEQSKLAKALNVVSRVAAGARATLPILNNVLIRVDGKKVMLTTTNLDMAVVDYLPTSKCKDGVVTVPARLLAEFVSNLPKGEIVKLSAKDNKVTISTKNYSSTINGTSADEYPELPDIDEKKAVIYRVGIDEFRAGVSEVILAASNDMTRPALTGVYFNTYKDTLYIAATDGYRLAEKRFINGVKSSVAAIVPAVSLQEVLRSVSEDIEEVEILFDEAQVRFRLGETEITSKLIDSSYPDYRQLIPKDATINLELSRSELARVVKLAALFSRNTGGSVVCETKKETGTFSVHTVVNELGENDSEIKVDKVENDAKIVLNARYVMDALNVLSGDKVEFNFSENGTMPVVMRNVGSVDYTHLIMPLKV